MSVSVLDSSVALKWVLQEAGTIKAFAFRDHVRNLIHEIIHLYVFPLIATVFRERCESADAVNSDCKALRDTLHFAL